MCESIDIFTSDSPPPSAPPARAMLLRAGLFCAHTDGCLFSGGGVAPFLAVVYVACL